MLVNEDRLRDSVQITRTPKDKGWQTTVKLSIYDNGIVGVNDLPLNPNPSQGMDIADERMPTALAVIVDEFKRQVEAQSSRI
jgi:hypothetical protein